MQDSIADIKPSKHRLLPVKGAYFIYDFFIKPKTATEDSRRKEFILNIILVGLCILLIWSELYLGYSKLFLSQKGMSLTALSLILGTFVALLLISRKGYYTAASYILIAVFFASITYGNYRWGVSLPTTLLSSGLLIVIASILISTRFGFLVSLSTITMIATIGYLDHIEVIMPDRVWKTGDIRLPDVIQYSVILSLIATVSWLSNRELERSLKRARNSEAELKAERDLLEVKVEERTKELKKVQAEKMYELYRFAELGRLSSGIFHDLINPLTTVAISIKQLKDMPHQDLKETEKYVENGIAAARRMEGFIQTIRKQLSHQEIRITFSLNEEVQQVLQLFDYKARKAGLNLLFDGSEDIMTFGNPLKFHQVVANLVSNGIDAYDDMPKQEDQKRDVEVRLSQLRGIARLEVQDWGQGIDPKNAGSIFDAFFTTKSLDKGTGIGLATTKNITEKEFGGSIKFESSPGKGSTFIFEFAV